MKDFVESFREDGFVHIREAISQHVVDDLGAITTALFEAHSKSGENVHETCIRLNKENQPLLFRLYQTLGKSVAMDSVRQECIPYVKRLLNPGVMIDLGPGMLLGIPNDERIVYDWHQEIPYHREIENVAHLWLPVLEETTKTNGTMSALKGSHKLGLIPYDKKPKITPNSTTNLVPRGIDKIKETHPETFFLAKPRDLVVLHPYVVHRSNTNIGKTVRFVCSLRIASVIRVPDSYDFSVKD